MNRYRRSLFLFLLAGFLIFLGLVFQQFLLDNIVLPVATVFWLWLRIFVLSIDQQIYWWLLIGLIVLLAILRLLRESGTYGPDRLLWADPTLEHIDYWRTLILAGPQETVEAQALKRNLRELLTALYTTRQQGSANFQVEEALRERQIPLPDPVYAFLFSEAESPRPTFLGHPIGFIRYLWRSMRQAPERWIRRWSGRETAEYLQAIEQVLILMEPTGEMKHGDEFFSREH